MAAAIASVFAIAAKSESGFAQGARTATADNFAVIEGVVVDSLHYTFLRGAALTVDGMSVVAFTDSLGRFRIDSVPPGSRRVQIMHAILDSIGIAPRTPLLALAAGQQLHIVLAVPSAQTVVAVRCADVEQSLGPAALLGTVTFAESERPAVGSQVILEFIEIRISGRRIESIPFRRTTTVAANGRFKLCGLPENLSASLMAVNGGDSTTWIGAHLASRVGIIGLELPDPIVSGTSSSGGQFTRVVRTGNAVLTGRVLDPNGSGLARARVSISGDSAVALSDVDGRFVLRNLRSGTRALWVRRLGFAPAELPVSLHARSPTDVTVRLERFVVVLDTVRVTAMRDRALSRLGFLKRKTAGMGYYLTPEEIASRHALYLPDLLAMAPMLQRVVDSVGRDRVAGRPRGFGNGCVTWWVDGNRWLGGEIEDFIRPDDVAAVEVYSGAFTPAQFQAAMSACETVVLWTKQNIH